MLYCLTKSQNITLPLPKVNVFNSDVDKIYVKRLKIQ